MGRDRTLPDVGTSVAWMHDGTAVLLEQLDRSDLAAPSLLPGWSNGHVAAHIARNAEGLLRLLHWANTGEETPMYASSDARNADIERDAGRPLDVQQADVRATAAALADAVAATPDEVWTVEIRSTRRGITAAEVPWMRVKEVWLHGIDLGAPTSSLPADVAVALVDDIAADFSSQENPPTVRLLDTESGHVVDIGHDGPTVSGHARDLAVWLAGRSSGAQLDCVDGLPVLPAWL